MAEININAHYTSSPKVHRPINTAVTAPSSMPNQYSFNDSDAKKRLKELHSSVNKDVRNEQKTSLKKFLKIFGAIVLTILGIKGVQRIMMLFK